MWLPWPAAMRNDEIARVFDEIADLLELTGANFFRVRAYRNAARTVRDHPAQFLGMTPDEMREIPGIGEELAAKIAALNRGEEIKLLRELRDKVPAGLVELMKLPGLGPKRVHQLAEELKVQSVEDLRKAVESGALESLHGFGAKMTQRLSASLAAAAAEPAAKRRLYAEVAPEVEELLAYLRKSRAVKQAEVAGSFRRRRDTIGDLDVLAISSEPDNALSHFLTYPQIAERLAAGETKSSVVLRNGLQVDVRVLPAESYGAALLYFTGSKAHGIHIRRIAQSFGYLLNEYGLFKGKKRIAGLTEQEIYAKLKLSWIPPELREDRGEVEAAAGSKLPRLVERADLRGDLHTHSTYTDGRASIEEMARAARDAGLQYFAVTDHSRHLKVAHGLDPARLRSQWREIERVEKRLGGIRILRGIEVDILDDGSLDLPDEVLGELDWVVASVHYRLEEPGPEMTRRLVRAISNPHVDVIGHPSNRLIGQRAVSNFDLGEVLRAAAGEGCALEVNSQPERLDLDDTNCAAALQAGVKLVISSDAHHPSQFAGLAYGVNQARRGWVQARNVLNTRPLAKLRQRR